MATVNLERKIWENDRLFAVIDGINHEETSLLELHKKKPETGLLGPLTFLWQFSQEKT